MKASREFLSASFGQISSLNGIERTLRPGCFEKAERHAGFVQCFPDQVPAWGVDVSVPLAEDLGSVSSALYASGEVREKAHHQQLSLDVLCTRERVIVFALSQAAGVDVCSEIAHGGIDSTVQGAAVGKVSAETHSRGADAAITGFQAQ